MCVCGGKKKKRGYWGGYRVDSDAQFLSRFCSGRFDNLYRDPPGVLIGFVNGTDCLSLRSKQAITTNHQTDLHRLVRVRYLVAAFHLLRRAFWGGKVHGTAT